jgi:hypothetical protein
MAKRYYADDAVRAELSKRLAGRTMTSVAKEAGVKVQHISVMNQGASITGKVLAWLGYRRVEGLYERIEK